VGEAIKFGISSGGKRTAAKSGGALEIGRSIAPGG
jgi:hypothetical protein